VASQSEPAFTAVTVNPSVHAEYSYLCISSMLQINGNISKILYSMNVLNGQEARVYNTPTWGPNVVVIYRKILQVLTTGIYSRNTWFESR
jgi:hypothetical protein